MENTTKIILGSLSLGLFVGSSKGSTDKHYFFVEKYATRMRPWIVTHRGNTLEVQSYNIDDFSPDCLIPISDKYIKMIQDPRTVMMYNGIKGSIVLQFGNSIKNIPVDCGLVPTERSEMIVNMLLSVKDKENKLEKWNRREVFTGVSENPKFILEVANG